MGQRGYMSGCYAGCYTSSFQHHIIPCRDLLTLLPLNWQSTYVLLFYIVTTLAPWGHSDVVCPSHLLTVVLGDAYSAEIRGQAELMPVWNIDLLSSAQLSIIVSLCTCSFDWPLCSYVYVYVYGTHVSIFNMNSWYSLQKKEKKKKKLNNNSKERVRLSMRWWPHQSFGLHLHVLNSVRSIHLITQSTITLLKHYIHVRCMLYAFSGVEL